MVEDYEIQALLRVTPTAARSLRNTLLATYSDDADDLTLAWALTGAHRGTRVNADGIKGTELVFTGEDRRDAFIEHAARIADAARALLGDDAHPWRAVVSDDFPLIDLPKSPSSTRCRHRPN